MLQAPAPSSYYILVLHLVFCFLVLFVWWFLEPFLSFQKNCSLTVVPRLSRCNFVGSSSICLLRADDSQILSCLGLNSNPIGYFPPVFQIHYCALHSSCSSSGVLEPLDRLGQRKASYQKVENEGSHEILDPVSFPDSLCTSHGQVPPWTHCNQFHILSF